jgi:hypothetical protein
MGIAFIVSELNCDGDECGRDFTCCNYIRYLDRQLRTRCEFCKFMYCEGIVGCKFWHRNFCQTNASGANHFILFVVQIMT